MPDERENSQAKSPPFDLPEPHVVPPALRKKLQECYDRATALTKQEKFDADYVNALLTECVIRDPENAVYVNAFLENLQRKYKNNKKGARLGGFGGKGGIKKAAAKKEWKEILKIGPPLLKTNPWDVQTLRAIAEACEAHGYNESELRYLKNALDANPKDADVNRHCGRSLARMGQFQQAIVCWSRVEEIKKNDSEAREMISLLTLERNRNSVGIPADPQLAKKLLGEYAYHRFLASQKEGKTDSTGTISIETINSAESEGEAKDPAATDDHAAEPAADNGGGREIKRTAQQQLQQAVRDNPAHVENYLKLGELLIESGRLADAEQVLEMGLEASGNQLQVREKLEDVLILRAKERAAIAEKQAAVQDTPASHELVQQLLSEVNRHELEVFTGRSQRYPEDLSLAYNLAVRLKRSGNYAEAMKVFERATESDEFRASALLERGECLQQLRQFKKALDYYKKARKAAEHGSAIHQLSLYRAAVLSMGLKEWKHAEKHLKELSQHDPDYKDVKSRLDKVSAMRQNT